ncbi:MAG: hypothetical protein JW864_17925 [Spirochaetes bacterium]|nr:hypothetical protein [Spirochaetota bacterium]
MKLLKVILIIFIFAVIPVKESFSMEIIAGPRIWYVTWKPWLSDAGQTAADRYFGLSNIEMGGGWMYGGSAAVRITNDISISASYLYGTLASDFGISDRGNISGDDIEFEQRGNTEINRHDIDLAVSYSISSMFKIFAGYKYQPVSAKLKSSGADYNYNVSAGNYNTTLMEMDSTNQSPAAGAGLVLQFADKFLFSANLSALYMFGSMDYKHTRNYYEDADLSDAPDTEKVTGEMDLHGWGFNFEPSAVASLTDHFFFVLGFRYQMVVMEGEYKGDSGTIHYSDMYDHVYGLYLF